MSKMMRNAIVYRQYETKANKQRYQLKTIRSTLIAFSVTSLSWKKDPALVDSLTSLSHPELLRRLLSSVSRLRSSSCVCLIFCNFTLRSATYEPKCSMVFKPS